jgi:hypothetical protein
MLQKRGGSQTIIVAQACKVSSLLMTVLLIVKANLRRRS